MESREIKIPDFLRRENEKPLSKENETFLRLCDEGDSRSANDESGVQPVVRLKESA